MGGVRVCRWEAGLQLGWQSVSLDGRVCALWQTACMDCGGVGP